MKKIIIALISIIICVVTIGCAEKNNTDETTGSSLIEELSSVISSEVSSDIIESYEESSLISSQESASVAESKEQVKATANTESEELVESIQNEDSSYFIKKPLDYLNSKEEIRIPESFPSEITNITDEVIKEFNQIQSYYSQISKKLYDDLLYDYTIINQRQENYINSHPYDFNYKQQEIETCKKQLDALKEKKIYETSKALIRTNNEYTPEVQAMIDDYDNKISLLVNKINVLTEIYNSNYQSYTAFINQINSEWNEIIEKYNKDSEIIYNEYLKAIDDFKIKYS